MKGDERILWCNCRLEEELHVNRWCKKQIYLNNTSSSLPPYESPRLSQLLYRAINISVYTINLSTVSFQLIYWWAQPKLTPNLVCDFIQTQIQWLVCSLVYSHFTNIHIFDACLVFWCRIECQFVFFRSMMQVFRSTRKPVQDNSAFHQMLHHCMCENSTVCLCASEVHFTHSDVLMHGSLVKLSLFPLLMMNLWCSFI